MTEVHNAAEAVRERLNPALDRLEENVRQGKRAIVRARHTAEDGVAAAALQVRRHPLSAVALSAGVGALIGGLLGVALGWGTHRQKS